MSRKTTTLFWLCLLSLFPLLSAAQTLARFYYWIDDNIGDMQTKSLSGTSAEIIEELDLSALSMGVHKVCFRVVQSDGYQSAVSHLLFFKGIMGSGGTLEYWFDDMYDQRVHTPFDAGNGKMQELTLDLRSNTTFPMGFHKLNLRVIMNGKASPVYTSHVLKLMAGSPNKLEYWIDGDIANSKTIDGQVSADGSVYLFTSDLDLGDVTPGYHRLFCRGVSSSRRTVTAVVSTPVIVKSKYNQDGSKAVLVSYDIAIDNEDAVSIPFQTQKAENEINRMLDCINLTEGQHEVKVRVANSMGLTAATSSKFTFTKPVLPSVTLTATEDKGKVMLTCNSIPRDEHSKIVRVDGNGARRVVYAEKHGVYPTTITFTDLPASGAYTYYVETRYSVANDVYETAKSNEVKVNVATAAADFFGDIVGVVRYDGSIRKGHPSIVKYGDGKELKTTSNGTFRMENIPVGSQMTFEVAEGDDYTTTPVTITIQSGRNRVELAATRNYDYNEDGVIYDLMFADNVAYEPGKYLKVKVKRYQPKTWTGKLRLCVIEKDKDFMQDGHLSPIDVVAKNVYGMQKNYYQVDSEKEFQLSTGDQTMEVTFPLNGLKVDEVDKVYNFHVMSLGTTGPARWVLPNPATDSAKENPLAYLLSESGDDYLGSDDINFIANILAFLTGKMEGMSGNVGGMKVNRGSGVTAHVEPLGEFIEQTQGLKNNTVDGVIKKIKSCSSIDELRKDETLIGISRVFDQYLGSTTTAFDLYHNSINDNLIQTSTKEAAWRYLANAISLFTELKDYQTIYHTRDFFECAETIISMSGVPYAAAFQTYLEVGRAALSAIKNISWRYNAPQLAKDFYHKEVGIKVNVYKKDGKMAHPHSADYVEKIVVRGTRNQGSMTATYMGYVNENILDGKVFKQQTYEGKGLNPDQNEGYPFDELWADVYWINGRVSHVPLDPNFMSVEYNRPNFVISFQSKASESANLVDLIELK